MDNKNDRTGNTLVVWFGNPQDEVEAKEMGDEVILMKDHQGQVIGFEKLNFLPPSDSPVRITFETIAP
ncbi:DUF2283 domain-containing protein [Synechococcus sp. Nb3U1]|uniref:DUF2283 domain-containing protein n=1 Tax=Synechococcus sp. Nb3U1 TaxID=1914529 RepID=UPI001F1847DF|nr:DUF2283 domain-containing protein [Synechococcus sp. Nb3U1]